MRANALRTILLVKSVEDEDADGAMLTPAERDAATREALRRHAASAPAPGPAGRVDRSWDVLEARADDLHARLVARHPVVMRTISLETRATQAALVVVAIGLVIGLLLSVADSRVRIEIVAFPLLGLVLWNLAVYLLLALGALRRPAAPPTLAASQGTQSLVAWPARWGWRRAAALIRQASFYHRPLAAALRRYSDEWWPHAQPLLVQQGKRVFHLAAAAAALGLVAGLYVRGIALEYRAGWESTFLGPEEVRSLLHWIYGPASAVSSIALPATAAEVEVLHWRGGAGGGPAASWIHLVAVTALLFVVLPRLLLAAWSTLALTRLSRNVTVPDSLLAYARRLLDGSNAALPAVTVRVTPYAYEPGAAASAGLQYLLGEAFGVGTRTTRRPTVSYGEEMSVNAEAVAAHSDADAAHADTAAAHPDIDVLLFNLASTPEAENHGALLLAAGAADGDVAARRLALVDESAFLARMGGDASLAPRVEERRNAWREFIARHGWGACLVDLEAVARASSVVPETLDALRTASRGTRR